MIDGSLLGGDFNEVLQASEKRGGLPASARKCALFQNRIDSCRLMDLDAIGHKFTWRGPMQQGGIRIYERLGGALRNDEWRVLFPDAQVRVLPRMEFSDHHPIIISLKEPFLL